MKMIFIIKYVLICLFYTTYAENVCHKDECQGEASFGYLLYDVNPSEGFNLRRDVYMRMAILAHKLRNSPNAELIKFKLILPPWSHLIHWSYSSEPEYIPWGKYFDLKSLQAFAPVLEMHEFFSIFEKNKYSKVIIENVYILQHFEEMFKTGKFEDKWEIAKCEKPPKLRYFHYHNLTSNNVRCISFHGAATKLVGLIKQTTAKTILIDHAEVALHDMFGDKTYWQARRSMRFNKELREIARQFRKDFLNSTNELDNTYLEEDWRNEKPRRNAKGGPYLAIHMRRRDFVRSRTDDIPDLNDVAKQISRKLYEMQLTVIFIATDAVEKEFEELKSKLTSKYQVYRYQPSTDTKKQLTEGGIAIVDQIICSYARYFIGTSESTFSFRIQEEREILGFPADTTFNALCKTGKQCVKPSVWKIVY